MTFSLSTNNKLRMRRSLWLAALLVLTCSSVSELSAKPSSSSKGTKGGDKSPEIFLRQHNTYSNVSFYFTNKGVLFNNDAVAGLTWPRGSGNTYIFGGGLWFATKKEIQGRRRKLCELGYNPNSGAGWFTEGEVSQYGAATDGASPAAKYISYVSPRYDKTSGNYLGGSSLVPAPGYNWPLWDTSASKTFKQNFYLGDYISDVNNRHQDKLSKNGKPALPAMVSEEDIFNIYSDADPTNNPEFKPSNGYPFNLDIQEVIYSWSFGRYRDMIFLRHKATNASKTETLFDCWMAPAFDPDLATANNDRNAYMTDSIGKAAHANLREPYASNPSKLNMGYQYSAAEDGKEYGMVGFSFLESPVVDEVGNIIENDDSVGLGGYGPGSLFQTRQLGLQTFKKWTIKNDPSTQDLRYDFVSSRQLDPDNIQEDMRLLFATGPFTLKPGKSVETVVAIGFARPSTTDKNKNLQALLEQIDFAHQVYGEPTQVVNGADTGFVINQFLSPVPPDIPNMKTQALDRAVLVSWDSTAERSVDILSPTTLPFLGYQLWRTTRSDRDSTIRPQGINPNVMLGQWQLYDYKYDTIFNSKGAPIGTRPVRTNATPHQIPHSYLDFGDDNHDGVLTGNEGLTNGVKYYYYLIAYDELDTINKLGPLYTSVVPPKNFITEVPAKPPFLVSADSVLSTDLANNCLAGGITKINLDVVDKGRFLQLFTNDTVCVAFQPRWTEYTDAFLDQSPLLEYVEVSDTRNGLALNYKNLHKPGGTPSTEDYNFTTGVIRHVNGSLAADSTFPGQFTTDRPAFSPNQIIDQTFRILVDYQAEQLNTPYRLRSLSVTGGDPSVVRLSRRTNIGGVDQDIYHLNDNGTRPAFTGALGEVTYEMTFGNPVPAPKAILAPDNTSFTPQVLPITIKLAGCADAILRHTQDSTTDVQKLFNSRYYSSITIQNGIAFANFNDPDTMYVPIPGMYTMDAWHFTDMVPTDQPHTNAVFSEYTSGPYYWNLGDAGNNVNNESHLVVHRLRLAGAEIVFNAPGVPTDLAGDSTLSAGPVSRDFQTGDKVTIPFTGLVKNLPFPGSCFRVFTPSGPGVQLSNAQNYTSDILSQVQVVPNPYIVTHLGQTSTDNARLYFTRLPPRATIEIYAIDGSLVKTLEHYGYVSTNTGSDPSNSNTTYDLNTLGDRSSVEEWNLLTEGKQRVGSQVLIARIIAKDAQKGDAVVAETTTKFAVIVGGTRIK